MPHPSGHAAASAASDEVRVGLREVGSAAAATLATFLDLQQTLVSQHPGSSQSQVLLFDPPVSMLAGLGLAQHHADELNAGHTRVAHQVRSLEYQWLQSTCSTQFS